jgi:hypothetical protein
MSNEDIKVTDSEAIEWASQLSDQDKTELKRQALLKRAIDLAQPEDKEPAWSRLGDSDFLKERLRRYGF